MEKLHPIHALIAQGEHQQLDFKFAINDSRKIARTLSAFANTDGGRLLIGVKDNGHIAGIRSDEEYYMIEAASSLYTRPSVAFEAVRWEIAGKSVLEVRIRSGADRPYLAPDHDGNYRAYIRVADENIPADEIVVMAWQKQRQPHGALLRMTRPVVKLLTQLDTAESYTNARRFSRMAHIGYRTAQQILSDLVAVGVLHYVVRDGRFCYERMPS